MRDSYSMGCLCLSVRTDVKSTKHYPLPWHQDKGYSILHEWIDGTDNHLKTDPRNQVTTLHFETPKDLLVSLMRGGSASRAGYNLFGCFLLRASPREVVKAAPDFHTARFSSEAGLSGRVSATSPGPLQMRRETSVPALPNTMRPSKLSSSLSTGTVGVQPRQTGTLFGAQLTGEDNDYEQQRLKAARERAMRAREIMSDGNRLSVEAEDAYGRDGTRLLDRELSLKKQAKGAQSVSALPNLNFNDEYDDQFDNEILQEDAYATHVPVKQRKTFAAFNFDPELIELVSTPGYRESHAHPMFTELAGLDEQPEVPPREASATVRRISSTFDETQPYSGGGEAQGGGGEVDLDEEGDDEDDDDEEEGDEGDDEPARMASTYSGFGRGGSKSSFRRASFADEYDTDGPAPAPTIVVAQASAAFYDDPEDPTNDPTGGEEFGFI